MSLSAHNECEMALRGGKQTGEPGGAGLRLVLISAPSLRAAPRDYTTCVLWSKKSHRQHQTELTSQLTLNPHCVENDAMWDFYLFLQCSAPHEFPKPYPYGKQQAGAKV